MRAGAAAAKSNVRPILFIQALAVALVLSYWLIPSSRGLADWIGASKAASGPLGAFVAGFIAGGIVPEFARLVTRERKRPDLAETAFVGFVYGVIGLLVDAFYFLQSHWFGDRVDVPTVVLKVSVDMLLAAPLVFVPVTVGLFLWRESGFSLRAVPSFFNLRVYQERVLSIQVMNWVVWTPVLFAVYALPLSLQFPLAALVEACWSLLVVVMARPKD